MIKVKKKNMLVLTVVLMAIFTISLAAGGINAYLIAKSNLTNEIDIGNSDVSIVEDVTFPWELAPGDTTEWLFDTFTIKTTESGTALTVSDMEDFDILVYAESKPCDSDSEVRNVW